MIPIDKEIIYAEIERLKKNILSKVHHYPIHRIELLDGLLVFLDSLPGQKPKQKDIETEIGHWMNFLDDKYCMFIEHYSIQDIKDTARHFYELGLKVKKK